LSAIEFMGYVTAALSGAVLANLFDYEFNYALSVLSIGVGFLITLSLREPPAQAKPDRSIEGGRERGSEGMVSHTKRALWVFKGHPLVFLSCLTGAAIGACMIYLDEFWQIALEKIEFPVLLFGLVSAALLAIRIPGNLLAYKLKERFGYKRILVSIVMISALAYASLFLIRNPLCLIPMMLLAVLAGIADPLVTGYLHHHAESQVRATVESFSSLGLRVLSAGIGLLFGYVSERVSIFAGFLVLSGVCLGYLGPLLGRLRKSQ
jgi:MFS family permease